jgi:hypothetical protein
VKHHQDLCRHYWLKLRAHSTKVTEATWRLACLRFLSPVYRAPSLERDDLSSRGHCDRHEQLPHGVEARRHRALMLFSLLFLPLLACAPKPEESKALVKISNVKVWRTDEQTLKVSLDYDLEMGVRLPLPYKEVLVFPLEPKVELGGTLAPFELHVGTVGVTLQIPKDAGFDWKDLDDKDTCCIVSLKGMQEKPGTKTAHYERISNEVRVLPPQISG